MRDTSLTERITKDLKYINYGFVLPNSVDIAINTRENEKFNRSSV